MLLHLPRWDTFLHHLLVAATLGILSLVLELTHKLEWLDATMLRVTGTRGEAPAAVLNNLQQEMTRMPNVVLIDEKAYEQGFNQTSPLDRSVLARVVQLLVDRHAQLIAIDIDLSPSYAERDLQGLRTIDSALIDAASKKISIGTLRRRKHVGRLDLGAAGRSTRSRRGRAGNAG